jgi:sulfur-oxidizing protein SoxY
MKPIAARPRPARRRLLQGAAAMVACRALPSTAAPEMPDIPLLAELLAGRTPRWERLRLQLPALADNGLAVPLKLSMPGPFAPGPTVQAIHLFSEKNPVPDMASFEFQAPLEHIELETRVRLAGTQKVVAVAVMSDAGLYAAAAEVIVTIAACLDGS